MCFRSFLFFFLFLLLQVLRQTGEPRRLRLVVNPLQGFLIIEKVLEAPIYRPLASRRPLRRLYGVRKERNGVAVEILVYSPKFKGFHHDVILPDRQVIDVPPRRKAEIAEAIRGDPVV
jgi:hypothetical protein